MADHRSTRAARSSAILPRMSSFVPFRFSFSFCFSAIVPLAASTNIYRGVASSDKKLIRYADCRHEIFEDEEGPRYFADIAQWLSAHAPGSNAAATVSPSSPVAAAAPVQAESVVVVPASADAVIAITAE